MFRPKYQPTEKQIKPIESSATDRDAKSTYELLWRKKTNKKHKTWEGDAVGYMMRSKVGGPVLIAMTEGRPLCTVKLSVDQSELEPGTVLSAGNVEIEIGSIVSTPKPSKMLRLEPDPFQSPNNSLFLPDPLKISVNQVSPIEHTTYSSRTASLNKARQPQTPSKPTIASNLTIGLGALDAPFRVPIRSPLQNLPTPSKEDLLPQLRPHQVEAVKFIKSALLGTRHRYGSGCILADEMGLGKTLTAIALLHNMLANNHIRNALIVCPVSLISNWKAEFKKWLPPHSRLGVLTIDQNGLGNGGIKDPAIAFFKDRQFKSYQILIVGYERVRKFSSQLQSANKQFDLVICDEGHRLKSSVSATTEALVNIVSDKRLLLTGTPIQNNLREFWALADFVNPGCLGSEAKFARKYSQPIDFLTAKENDVVSWEDLTSSQICEEQEVNAHNAETIERSQEALIELTQISEEFMLRRTSEVISKYIPVRKTEYVVFCRPSEMQVRKYEEIVGSFTELMDNRVFDSKTVLEVISKLKKVAAGDSDNLGGKLTVLSYLIDVISSNTDEKLVIVSGSTRVLDLCQNILISKQKTWLRLDGSTPQDKRISSVNIFNRSDAQRSFAFLLSSRSGGMGLNLIGGSRMVLLDCDWNPAIDTQVMARIHRDGQKRCCYIYRFLTTGTIDEKIFQRQLSKISLSKNVLLDAAQNSNITKTDFSKEALRDLFLLHSPDKCNTLDSLGKDGGIKGYLETDITDDPVLKLTVSKTNIISCILQKNLESTSN